MKKVIVLVGFLCLVFSGLSWAGTIDTIDVTGTWPFTVNITGTYPDGCDRDTSISSMVLEEEIIIFIFTEASFPTPTCMSEPGQPFDFSESMDSPVSESYSITVIMYEGMLGMDQTGTVLASKTKKFGSSVCEPCEPCEPSTTQDEPEEELAVYLDVNPEVINVNRHGKYIGGKIRLPVGYMPEGIDAESVELGIVTENNDLWTVSAEKSAAYDETFVVKFNTDMVVELIDEVVDEYPATVTFFVRGQMGDGLSFSGTDITKVINHGKLCKFKKCLKKKLKKKHCNR